MWLNFSYRSFNLLPEGDLNYSFFPFFFLPYALVDFKLTRANRIHVAIMYSTDFGNVLQLPGNFKAKLFVS